MSEQLKPALSRHTTDPIPDDKGGITEQFEQRLRAWKHVVKYLEEYVEAMASLHKGVTKDYEKVAKIVGEPLKEADSFDQQSGAGITALFTQLHTATQGISLSHAEAEKNLRTVVLVSLEKLHQEIKDKQKDLLGAASKASESVTKARELTQKQLELLGQHTAAAASNSSAKVEPLYDPYLLKRGVLHRLHKQVAEENGLRQDLLVVQDNFKRFEIYIVETIQATLNTLYSHVAGQADKQKAVLGDVVAFAQRIVPDYEWNQFLVRHNDILIDPNSPLRSVDAITFPNQHHQYTIPVVDGHMQRKGKLLGRYTTYYYVVTASKYLHEYKDNTDVTNEIEPEMSLYLPECQIGGLSASPAGKFTISGKDALKNKNLTQKHEFAFKANSHEEAKRFHDAIQDVCAGRLPNATPPVMSPIVSHPPSYEASVQSPAASRQNGTLDATAAGSAGAASAAAVDSKQTVPAAASPVVPQADKKVSDVTFQAPQK